MSMVSHVQYKCMELRTGAKKVFLVMNIVFRLLGYEGCAHKQLRGIDDIHPNDSV